MRKFFFKMAVFSVISMGFLTIFLVAGPVLAQGGGGSVAKPATPAAFVDKIGIDLLDSIRNGTITGPTGEEWFRSFIHVHFDIETIARFSLGRYWRIATVEQQKDYVKLFDDMIVKVYSRRFRDYSGESFKVVNAQPSADRDVMVATTIQPIGKPAINTQWRVRSMADGSFKVVDLIVENISMAVTQRAEFASVIEQNGGQIDSLLASLRQRIAAAGG